MIRNRGMDEIYDARGIGPNFCCNLRLSCCYFLGRNVGFSICHLIFIAKKRKSLVSLAGHPSTLAGQYFSGVVTGGCT